MKRLGEQGLQAIKRASNTASEIRIYKHENGDTVTIAPVGGILSAIIARKPDLKPGRLLKPGHKGRLICAKSRREARFVFIRYIEGLRAEVATY